MCVYLGFFSSTTTVYSVLYTCIIMYLQLSAPHLAIYSSMTDNLILLHYAALPLPPLLTYSNVSYGIDEYSVRVQWQTLSDDGAVDNYTLTLYRDEIMIEMSLLKANTVEHYISLNYSTNYTFAVYTSNCIGSGNSTYIYIVKGGDV